MTGRRLILGNAAVRISYVVADTPSPFYRNGTGDECVFVESGRARVETVFGTFDVTTGDCLVIPRATTHRWIPGGGEPLRAYCIEATSHIAPQRCLSKCGQLLENAPYCPVPYYHSNVDSDEIMFYVAGDYEARKGSGIGRGSVSVHPGGHAHGPQPGAYERSIGAGYFDELAVMVDTFRPLELGEAGRAVDDGTYAWSWIGGKTEQALDGAG